MSQPKTHTEELLAAIQHVRSRAAIIDRDVSEIKRRILLGTGTETFVSLTDINNVTKTELSRQNWFIPADGSVLFFERPSVVPIVPEVREPVAKRNYSLVSKEVEPDKDNAEALANAKRRLEELIVQRDACKTDSEKAALTEKIEKLEQLVAVL